MESNWDFNYGLYFKCYYIILCLLCLSFTHQPALARMVGYGPFSLCVIHKEGLCPSSGDINRLMMMSII
jgi:hypothetical protein